MERVLENRYPDAYYVKPAVVEMSEQNATVREETFAPILYALKYGNVEDAIRIHNGVPQGLASSIFTNDVREAEAFISADGSDCGISNVNIGPMRRRDRRRFRRRERHRRRPRVGLGRVEGVYAPRHQHDQLFAGAALGPGHQVRRGLGPPVTQPSAFLPKFRSPRRPARRHRPRSDQRVRVGPAQWVRSFRRAVVPPALPRERSALEQPAPVRKALPFRWIAV